MHRVTTKRRRKRHEETTKTWSSCLVLSSFALLLTLWILLATRVMSMISLSDDTITIDGERGSSSSVVDSSSVQSVLFRNKRQPTLVSSSASSGGGGEGSSKNAKSSILLRKQRPSPNTTPIQLLSRNPKVIITSSARGNLGPPTVLNQNPPGKDWIKDRWQAASDMHGTAIKGSHWVLFDFSQLLQDGEMENKEAAVDGEGRRGIQMTKIVLDWETAFAKDYRIEVRMDRPIDSKGGDNDEWCVLYDGGKNDSNNNNELQFHESSYGQSPGVKQKLPLHIIHTIDWASTLPMDNDEQSSEGNHDSNGKCQTTSAFRYLRVFIRKSARGWGVSLWEVDVYGTIVN